MFRPLLRVSIATLAAFGVMCGAAVAMNPYTVHIAVPGTVTKGSTFHARVYGHSANTSVLTVFHDDQACATTSSREQGHSSATKIVSQKVTGKYSVTRKGTAAKRGKHYICAYLTGLPPQSLPRAHAAAAYTVT